MNLPSEIEKALTRNGLAWLDCVHAAAIAGQSDFDGRERAPLKQTTADLKDAIGAALAEQAKEFAERETELCRALTEAMNVVSSMCDHAHACPECAAAGESVCAMIEKVLSPSMKALAPRKAKV
jgi:hypothetical protein